MNHIQLKLMLSGFLGVFSLCVFATTPPPAPLVVGTTKKVFTPVVKPVSNTPIIQQNITTTKSTPSTKPSTTQATTKSLASPTPKVNSGNFTTNLPTKSPANIDMKNTGGNVGGVSGPMDGSTLITDQPTKN